MYGTVYALLFYLQNLLSYVKIIPNVNISRKLQEPNLEGFYYKRTSISLFISKYQKHKFISKHKYMLHTNIYTDNNIILHVLHCTFGLFSSIKFDEVDYFVIPKLEKNSK